MARIKQSFWLIGSAALAAIAAAAIIMLLSPASALPPELANGNYSNDCCGTIELRDGEMTANGARWITYRIERDEHGPYVLPARFVGTQDRGIVLDGGRPVVKLRVDRLPNPTQIRVPGVWGPDNFLRDEP